MSKRGRCSIRTSKTCPGFPRPARDARLFLRCSDQPWVPAECRLDSLADINRAGQAPDASLGSLDSVNCVASLFELLPASDGDRTPIPSTQAVLIGGFVRFQQAAVNMVSQSITAKLVPHHGAGLLRPCVPMLQRGAPRDCDPAQRGAGTPATSPVPTTSVVADGKASPRLGGVCIIKLSRRSS